MGCQCLSACNRTIQHLARQLCVCQQSHLYKLVIVLSVLIALQYLINTNFEASQFEPLFTLNSTNPRILSQGQWINNSSGLLFPSHNSSFNGSMHVSMNGTLSPIKNVTGDTSDTWNIWNSCFILTLTAVDNASTPDLTVPFTGKSLCPLIPPNLSKYYESLHFTFFISLVAGAYSGL
jgi:hypothetical protein